MAIEAYITVNGNSASKVHLTVPFQGVWFADVDLHDATKIKVREKVSLKIGKATLVGTVRSIGSFADSSQVRIVAGGDGWSQVVQGKGYANDANVLASTVITDLAREVNETIGTNATNRLGAGFAREGSVASYALDAAVKGNAVWWVGYDGITNIGTRANTIAPESITVLNYDGICSVATIDANEVNIIFPGMRIKSRLDETVTIRSIDYEITHDKFSCTAWCGANGKISQAGDALVAIIKKVINESLHGVYRYRIVERKGERLTLQAVKENNVMPDLPLVAIWPGNYGMHSIPDVGKECLVAFADGDRDFPVVLAFQPGSDPNIPVARQNDVVEILAPTAVITGTLSGVTPFTGVITFPTFKLQGIITGGSGKARQE
jgi:hypothetical protein